MIAKGTAIGVAAEIMRHGLIVAVAVDFDDKFDFATEKIREVTADGHLAAKFEAQLLATQLLPEKAFRRCGFFAEFFGTDGISVGEVSCRPTP